MYLLPYFCVLMSAYLLHIDTATDTGTVALSKEGKIISLRNNLEARNHAGTINIMIQEVLSDANILLQDIAAVVVCGGPGSYTGLRIGVATAKGLCYALDKPLLMDNRLTLLAYNAYKKGNKNYSRYISLLMAREKEYFISIYDNSFNCLTSPQHITEEQLMQLLAGIQQAYVVTDSPLLQEMGEKDIKAIDTDTAMPLETWGIYAYEQLKCNDFVNLATAEPLYLKQVHTHK